MHKTGEEESVEEEVKFRAADGSLETVALTKTQRLTLLLRVSRRDVIVLKPGSTGAKSQPCWCVASSTTHI